MSTEAKYGQVTMRLGEAGVNHLVTIPIVNKKGERIKRPNGEPIDIFCLTVSREQVPAPKVGKVPVKWLDSDPFNGKPKQDKPAILHLSPDTPVTFYCPNNPIGPATGKQI